jgi:spore coat protein SA
MIPTVAHLLDENETFSSYRGGAISRWIANVLRHEASSLVICADSDATWEFPPERVLNSPGYRLLRSTSNFRMPATVKSHAARLILAPQLKRLSAGDVLWIHNRPEYAAVLAPRLKKNGVKTVLHLHNSVLEWKRDSVLCSLDVDKVVFCSKFLRDATVAKYSAMKTAVAYYGADESIFYPGRSHQNQVPQVVFTSRLVPEKGAHVLIDALKILTSRSVDAKLTIIGAPEFGRNVSNPYVESLKRGATENIEFSGYRSSHEIAEILRGADIFCAPVVWDEPLGMMNLEAMACRMAIVSTKSGAIPEVFADGGAILVEPNSSMQLADALQRLLLDSNLRSSMANDAFEAFNHRFRWPKVIEQYRAVLNCL